MTLAKVIHFWLDFSIEMYNSLPFEFADERAGGQNRQKKPENVLQTEQSAAFKPISKLYHTCLLRQLYICAPYKDEKCIKMPNLLLHAVRSVPRGSFYAVKPVPAMSQNTDVGADHDVRPHLAMMPRQAAGSNRAVLSCPLVILSEILYIYLREKEGIACLLR